MGAVAFTSPRKLRVEDELSDFFCGMSLIDEWAHNRATKASLQGTAVVYVVFCGDIPAGLYSLSAHSVLREEVKQGWLKRNTPYRILAVLLGMLGVDERFKGQGLGASLLGDAIRRSLLVSEQIGARALLVDPVDEGSEAFYAKYGFRHLAGSQRMFLPLV